MSKPRKQVYVYKDRLFLTTYPSIENTSSRTKDSIPTIRAIMKGETKRGCSKRGYVYTDHELTKEEINSLPIIEDEKPQTREQPQNEEEETQGFYFGKTKKEKINKLRLFLQNVLQERWRNHTKTQTDMERKFINQVLDELLYN